MNWSVMKRMILLFCLVSIGFQLHAQKDGEFPAVRMKFEEEHIELGIVKKGDKRSFDYVFTNIGTENIVIEIVSGCDCTTTDWPRKPIPPGGKGTIEVTFDSTEKEDSETVDVDITLKNVDPKTGDQIFKILTYSFELVE